MQTPARLVATAIALVTIAAALAGCRTTYTGYESDIDGVLWRQVAMREDFFWRMVHDARSEDLLIHDTRATVWDGASDAADLGIADSAVIIWDLEHTDHRYDFKLFISSGPRPDRPTDFGEVYRGPSEVFTCFGVTATFADGVFPEVERDVEVTCPEELIAQMPADAAFATDDVFDG